MNHKYLLPALASLLLMGCSNENEVKELPNTPVNINMTRSDMKVQESINAMAFKLMNSLEHDEAHTIHTPVNYVFSPQSLAWTLGMIANGAESETLDEIINAFELPEGSSLKEINEFSSKLINGITIPNRSAKVNICNLAISRVGTLLPGLQSSLKDYYNADVMVSPSSSAITQYLSKATYGVLNGSIDGIDSESVKLAFVNSLLFEGSWDSTFSTFDSKPMNFRNLDGTVSKPVFISGQKDCQYAYNDICHILRLPFKNKYFYLNFIIPTEGHDFDDVTEYLDKDTWRDLIVSCRSGNMEIKIPRINIESSFDLREPLADLGVNRAFSEAGAQLGKFTTGHSDLFISAFRQMSSFSIDENGAKIATQTAGMVGETVASPWKYFYLDEPFYFFVTEESSDAILFFGRVTKL